MRRTVVTTGVVPPLDVTAAVGSEYAVALLPLALWVVTATRSVLPTSAVRTP